VLEIIQAVFTMIRRIQAPNSPSVCIAAGDENLDKAFLQHVLRIPDRTGITIAYPSIGWAKLIKLPLSLAFPLRHFTSFGDPCS
jgi:hypothetical protein